MNVLIVHAHPEPQSFTTAMLKTAVDELTRASHGVEVSDLYAMEWNPVASAEDFGSRKNPEYLTYALEQRHAYEAGSIAPDIAAEIEKLKKADLVIFNFPIYWFSVPAILKGWIDRVLISGLCYGGMRFYDQGGLKGKKAALSFTLGGRPHMFGEDAIHGELDVLLRPLLRGTLAYVGMDVLPYFAGYHIPYLKPEARAEIMEQYKAWLAQLPAAQPLEFVKMGDFDEKLYPKK
ncbi:MAG: quinone oxidoreductase [Moraxellaceae bacterium]|jgi:NAD(P)H dehydrogenase (quinone)|nr:quinone oxidoreductase [Moraxellaceae bacterium]